MEEPTPPASDALVRLPADARCAVHADAQAFAVCRRCGNYMCRTCSRDGTSPQCDACRARGAAEFPFSRERWTFSGLVTYSWERFKVEWLMLSLTSLSFLALLYGISFAMTFAGVLLMTAMPAVASDPERGAAAAILTVTIQVVQVLLQLVIQMWLQLGFFAVALDVVEGRHAEVGKLFARFDRFPAALLQLLIIYAGMIVFFVPLGAVIFLVPGDEDTRAYAAMAVGAVLAIPGIYLALGFAFGMLELVHNPSASAISALRTSFEIVRGQRWSVLGAAFVIGFIGAAGVLACCIGVIPAVAFGTLIYCSLYLALRTPTQA